MEATVKIISSGWITNLKVRQNARNVILSTAKPTPVVPGREEVGDAWIQALASAVGVAYVWIPFHEDLSIARLLNWVNEGCRIELSSARQHIQVMMFE